MRILRVFYREFISLKALLQGATKCYRIISQPGCWCVQLPCAGVIGGLPLARNSYEVMSTKTTGRQGAFLMTTLRKFTFCAELGHITWEWGGARADAPRGLHKIIFQIESLALLRQQPSLRRLFPVDHFPGWRRLGVN